MIKCKYFSSDFVGEVGDYFYEEHTFDDTTFALEVEKISEFLYKCELTISLYKFHLHLSIDSAPLDSVVSFINDNIRTYV